MMIRTQEEERERSKGCRQYIIEHKYSAPNNDFICGLISEMKTDEDGKIKGGRAYELSIGATLLGEDFIEVYPPLNQEEINLFDRLNYSITKINDNDLKQKQIPLKSLNFLTEEECMKIKSDSKAYDSCRDKNGFNTFFRVNLCWIKEKHSENVINFTRGENKPYKTGRNIKKTLRIFKNLKATFPIIKTTDMWVASKEDIDNCEVKWFDSPKYIYGCNYVCSELPFDFEKNIHKMLVVHKNKINYEF